MRSQVAVTGTVASEPEVTTVPRADKQITKVSFRLADRSNRTEAAEGADWYVVECLGVLADNGAKSLKKGDSVVAVGALTITERIVEPSAGTGEYPVTTALIVAKVIGHDLRAGTSDFSPDFTGRRR